MTQDILRNLARAKATFQARTLETILTEGKPMTHEHTANEEARHGNRDALEAMTRERDRLLVLAEKHAAWSQATFGADHERDHTGPLNHLKKEISEIEAEPHDHSEWADGLMLILDAARRAGVSASDLLDAFEAKLEVNIKREWGEPNADGSVEHVRAALEDKQ